MKIAPFPAFARKQGGQITGEDKEKAISDRWLWDETDSCTIGEAPRCRVS